MIQIHLLWQNTHCEPYAVFFFEIIVVDFLVVQTACLQIVLPDNFFCNLFFVVVVLSTTFFWQIVSVETFLASCCSGIFLVMWFCKTDLQIIVPDHFCEILQILGTDFFCKFSFWTTLMLCRTTSLQVIILDQILHNTVSNIIIFRDQHIAYFANWRSGHFFSN